MGRMRILLALLLAISPAARPQTSPSKTPLYGYRVVHSFPHDPKAFTQGLEYRKGVFYEGTGLNGRSSLRKVEASTGKVLAQTPLPQRFFGEGITVLNDEIVQLTWQAHQGFVYSQSDLSLKKTFEYPGEGWGLTNDGKHIYMSDGTAEIRVWDPATLKEKRRIAVHEGREPVLNLNELEWVRGEIYANVWQTDRIARISPVDGKVLGWIDLTGILPPDGQHDVLNGIAFDPSTGRLFVTGKLWPEIFQITLVPKR